MDINFKAYKNIILDFDGVIADSNHYKEKAITKAAGRLIQDQALSEFVEYFTTNNGIPREPKIAKYFSGKDYDFVMEKYSKILKQDIATLQLTNKTERFLAKLRVKGFHPIILSGGQKSEIESILEEKGLSCYFQTIFGGPKTKEENVTQMNLEGKTLFIGDSKVDYQVSVTFGFDFIFMYGYTQFDNWRAFVEDKKLKIIDDLSELLSPSP